LHIALFRPLTALTHVLDYALWPDAFALQHAHSLLWMGLGVGLVAALYRTLHAPAMAGLAGLLFAVADSHAIPAGWLANRNALLCLVCGVLTVACHLRWRRTSGPAWLALALVSLAAGLCCGEATLGGLAYVAAWELAAENGSWRRRLGGLLPYGVLVGLWRVVYVALGFGAYGSSLYVDPGGQPLRFAGALVERWPLFMVGQWLQLPIDLWLMVPDGAQLALWLAAVAACVGLLALLWPLLRGQRLARFWATGTALSLVPLCAGFPMDRLLVQAGVGAFPLIAMLAESEGAWPFPRLARSAWRRRACVLLLVLHGPLAALLLVVRTATLPQFGYFFAMAAREAPAGPEVASQTFVFVNGNDFPVAYCGVIRQVDGSAPPPRRVAHLASMFSANQVLREDDRTLVVTPEEGFLAWPVDRLLSNPERRFAPGERIQAPDFTAEIRSVAGDGRPTQVAFRFRLPLEDPSLRWLYWTRAGLVAFPLPGPGESVLVRRANPFVG
jgi:hypothetical protein